MDSFTLAKYLSSQHVSVNFNKLNVALSEGRKILSFENLEYVTIVCLFFGGENPDVLRQEILDEKSKYDKSTNIIYIGDEYILDTSKDALRLLVKADRISFVVSFTMMSEKVRFLYRVFCGCRYVLYRHTGFVPEDFSFSSEWNNHHSDKALVLYYPLEKSIIEALSIINERLAIRRSSIVLLVVKPSSYKNFMDKKSKFQSIVKMIELYNVNLIVVDDASIVNAESGSYLSPVYRKVEIDEIPLLGYNINYLPQMSRDDIICRLHGFTKNDIIEINRGSELYYRAVV